jgi:hypothetical protein
MEDGVRLPQTVNISRHDAAIRRNGIRNAIGRLERMIPSALLRDAFLHDGFCPSKLGFLAIFLGGGVLHKPDVDTALRDGGDWDGLAVVRRKRDILHIIENMGTELCSLLKIDKQEVPLSYWKVGIRNPSEWYISTRFTCPTKR